MKNLYIVLLFLCSFSLTAQKVDYDNASKWFWGLNLGGTWQTTDVSNQTGAGWGITIGKSYNYNYGKPFSFDIRGRYLNGNWYGQDKDSTALTGLNQGNALYGYQNGLGYTYHNYKSNVHRLALELAIHLNALTQKTGWDPYIFGGVGLTWNRTYGNLTDSTDFLVGPTLYNYQTTGISAINFDNSYETALDGYSKYRVNVMPSLGFGLGYHIRKRTTIGFEHKTTFTLKDNFDAIQSALPRSKNDLYHYTSLYIQFRLRGRNNLNGTSSNNNVTNPNSFSSCPPPSVAIVSPANLTVTNPQFDIDFRANDVISQNEIQVLNGNNASLFFNFNTSTKQGKATVTLVPGVNTFTITARNRCGTDSKTFTVNYNNCSLPAGSFTNPNATGSTVKTQAYVLGAIVSGVQNKSAIKLYANGILLNNFSFNIQNGVIQANVNLNVGSNNFRIDLSNPCGNATIESNVNYDNCVAPIATFLNPSAAGTTVNSQNLVLRANVTGVSTNQQINLDVNGTATRNFTFTNGVLTANVALISGINTITIRLNNSCGTDTEVTTVNYQTCNAPIITVTSPTQNSKVTNPVIRLRTQIEHITSKNNLKIKLNGVDVSNFNYTVASKSSDASLTLINGLNTITVSATNNCGTDVETITVEYDNCVAPSVNITSSGNETTNNSYSLTAAITNMADANGITVSRNGQEIGFNYTNGQLFSAVTLLPGVNTFVVSATKTCGTASKTISVNYKDCQIPSVTIAQPSSGITVNTTQNSFVANTNNINSLNQVIVTLNNQPVNATLNAGIISGNLNLSEGLNTLTIKVTNACGTDIKTVTVNRVSCTPPNVSITTPTQNSTLNRATLAFEGNLQNANSYNLTLNGITTSPTRNGNIVRGNLILKPGNNVIVFSGTNACGNDSETITVVYDNCVPPLITINSNSANQTVNSSAFNVAATITNTTQNAIAFTLNGIQKPFSFTNGILTSSLLLNEGTNVIVISTANACGSDTKIINVNYVLPNNSGGSNGNNGSTGNTEEKIIICHYPPGNTGNPQQLEIPLSAWPAHQAHGDVIGPCPSNNNGNSNNGGGNGNNGNSGNGNPNGNNNSNNDGSNGNSGNANTNGNNNSNNGNSGNGNTEEKIIICHYPPGNTGNPQQLEIPLSAWPAHQAHGDVIGPCPSNNNGNSNNGGGNGNNGNSGNGNPNGNNNSNNDGSNGNSGNGNNNSNNGHGNNQEGSGGPNGTTDQSGNVDDELNGNGAGSNVNAGNGNSNGNNNSNNGGSNGNTGNGNSNGNNNSNNVGSNGNTGNGNPNGNNNSNNGHGNNQDGVDVSNPGQGGGGPNGTTDQSGNVDDELTGNGSGGNVNSGNGNSNGNNNSNNGGSNGNTGNGNSNGNGGGNNSNNVQADSTTGNGSNGNGGNTTGSNSDGSSNSSSNCLGPVITLPNLMRGGIVVSNPTFNLLGSVANYGATGQIAVSFNNNNVPVNISADESFVTTVTLNLGMNSFVVNTSNSCGSDSKSLNVELVSENLQNNGGNGNNNNQNGGQKAQQSSGKPTTNKPNAKPQVTNKPGQNNTNKTNPTEEKKEEKPKEETPKDNKPKVEPKINTTKKGGGK
ncbi:MAG: hypothetical protein ACOVQG_07320 [Crocinitomicaceae bacterium]